MMDSTVFFLKVLEKIALLLRKDPMKYRIARFRKQGANIGENVRAFSAITSAESYLITVGNDVTLSKGVVFITHDNSAIKIYDDATDFVGSIKIGDNCFVGMNTMLLPGVSIADDCIIGAGSVITKSVQVPGSIVAGNPARIIGNVKQLVDKRADYKFNFRNYSYEKKKEFILNSKNRWIVR